MARYQMTIARALQIACLVLEWEEENTNRKGAWAKECKEARLVLAEESKRRQPRPDYQGVHVGVS